MNIPFECHNATWAIGTARWLRKRLHSDAPAILRMVVQAVKKGMAIRIAHADKSMASTFICIDIMKYSGSKFGNMQWIDCTAENVVD